MSQKSVVLYCLPHAGGNSFFYRTFAPLCPEYVQISPLELPGRGRRSREPLCGSMEALADDLFPQIAANKGPYALFGHSMGAILAYLLAQRAACEGVRLPEVLFLSGAPAPTGTSVQARHHLPRDAFLEMLRELGGCPPEVLAEPALLEYFEPILRADFEAVDTWQPGLMSSLPLPFVVLSGNRDVIGECDQLAWGDRTSVGLTLHEFEGGHFFIQQHWGLIAEIVGESLNGANRCVRS